MRHASAGRFAPASAVEVHVFVSGEYFYLGTEIVGLNSDRAGNADGSGSIVTVAAHIGHQYLFRAFGLQLGRQGRHLHPWYDAIGSVPPVQRQSVADKRNRGQDDYNLYGVTCDAKS